jgi:hypothetical protein
VNEKMLIPRSKSNGQICEQGWDSEVAAVGQWRRSAYSWRRVCGCRGEASQRRVKACKPALDLLRSDWGRSGLKGEKGNESTGWQRRNQGDGFFFFYSRGDGC